jgi:hypothetical protein
MGTVSPVNRLQVVGGNTTIGISDSASGNRARLLWQTTSGSVGVGLFNDDNSNLMFGTNATERVRITVSGNVGINTTDPGYRLDVNGTTRNNGIINTSSVAANTASGNAIGSYVLGNGRWWQTNGGAQYLHFVLPARYNQNDSKMWCIEIKGYDFARPGIINIMIGGYVTPPSNGGPMSRVAVWDAIGYYSPTAYYSSNYACGVARIYFPDQYYASFTVNSIASGNGDVIAPDELRIIQSGSSTI